MTGCIWKPSGHHLTHSNDDQVALVLATNSVYILIPAVLGCFVQPRKIHSLPRLIRLGLAALRILAVTSACVSTMAWYHWTCWLGRLDEVLAMSFGFGQLVFGIARGSWMRPTTVSFFLAAMLLFGTEAHFEALGWRRPWPHFTSRCLLCISAIAAMYGDILHHNIWQFSIGVFMFCLVGYTHAFFEFAVAVNTPDWTWTKETFLWSLARTTVVMFISAALLAFTPAALCPTNKDQEVCPDDPCEKCILGWDDTESIAGFSDATELYLDDSDAASSDDAGTIADQSCC